MRIIWSPLAVERISEISDYIAEDNPDASIKWIESVFKVIKRLTDYPESGRVVPEFGKPNLREIIHGHYRIIYEPFLKTTSLGSWHNRTKIVSCAGTVCKNLTTPKIVL